MGYWPVGPGGMGGTARSTLRGGREKIYDKYSRLEERGADRRTSREHSTSSVRRARLWRLTDAERR